MIGYYVNAGGPKASELLREYLRGEMGFATMIDNTIAQREYGEDLKLLLVKYRIDGEVVDYDPVLKPVSNYSVKNKDIAVEISIRRNDFHNVSDIERKKFIVDSTICAIKLVEERLIKKKLDIKFNELLNDVNILAKDYIGEGSNTSK